MLTISGAWKFAYTMLHFLKNVPYWQKFILAGLFSIIMISVAQDTLENYGSFVRDRIHPFNLLERKYKYTKVIEQLEVHGIYKPCEIICFFICSETDRILKGRIKRQIMSVRNDWARVTSNNTWAKNAVRVPWTATHSTYASRLAFTQVNGQICETKPEAQHYLKSFLSSEVFLLPYQSR